jgi:large repetitive protein
LAIVRNTLALAATCVLAALGLIAPATAAAEGTPEIGLEKTQPAQALIGTQQEVHLTASNPAGQERGYNLSFRDVLPNGVKYVPGSASPVAPLVIPNAPNANETTLIFENVADLSANSKYHLDFKVEALPAVFKISELHSFTDEAEAFVDEEPRLKPNFEPNGELVPGSATGSAEDTATTVLTAVEIVKEQPEPEAEILRGVHEHQVVYTLKLRNNRVGPTEDLAVDDYLPAGLEFLGCGEVDNTTSTKTNEEGVNPEWEYEGSGPMNGRTAKPANCVEPTEVKTEEVDPPGPQPFGVYTHVVWTGLGELGPAEGENERKLEYVVGIPILKNEAFSPEAIAKLGALGQTANLDNNTGLETFDEEELTNVAEVAGEYEETPVSDSDELTVTTEDLAIQKTVTPTKIEEGGESIWTLDLEASEYRFVNGVEINDTLPNGLCPLGSKSYEKPGGAIVEKTAECEGAAGVEPTYEIEGVPGEPQTAEYTSIEYLPNGTFNLHWDESSFPALGQLAPSEHLILKVPTKTRTFYQSNYEKSTPVLTGDSWINKVKTQGDDFARCAPNDPLCTLGQPKIFTEEAEGEPDKDVSEAGQEAGGVEIDKTVRENEGVPVPENCSGKYVEGVAAPFPLYAPGDEICWTLRVKFAAKLFAGAPVVTDFIPTDEEYVPNSAIPAEAPLAPEGENTLEATFNKAAAEKEGALEWTLGTAVESGTQIFEWRFKTKVKKEPVTRPEQITGNLMKFTYSNTIGETFPLRDRAEVKRQEPELALEKGVTEVGGNVPVGAPATGVTVGGGEDVTYELKVDNAGNMDAEEVEVWDILPEGIECADVVEIGQAGTCDAPTRTLKWTGIHVVKAGSTPLTYKVKVPTDVAPGHAFVNKAGVARYKTPTNTGGKFEYIPAENINTALKETNTEPILAQAEIITTAAMLHKEASTETTLPSNGEQEATIGEIVTYHVTATIPPNSKIYGAPVLKDELPGNLELTGSSATLDGKPLSEGLTFEPLPNGAEVRFNGDYPATATEAEHTVVITLTGRVLDIPGNQQGVSIKNEASFEFDDVAGKEVPPLKKATETPVVEPHLEVIKHLLPSTPAERSTKVAPGEPVEYVTEVKNTGASTAFETSVMDTVPPGMEIVTPGTGTPVGSTISWTIPTIAPGETKELKYTLAVEEPATAASKFTNVVVAKTQSLPDVEGAELPQTRNATSPGAAGYEDNGEKEVTLVGAEVLKSVTPGEGTIGSEFKYTLQMKLPPQINFFHTAMVDQLPKGVSFDKTIATKCTGEGCAAPPESERKAAKPEIDEPQPDGTTLVGWKWGDFTAGKPRVLTVEFEAHIDEEAAANTELINALGGFYDEASATPEPPTLPIPGSETTEYSEETNVSKAVVKEFEPELKLTKTVSNAEAGKALPGHLLTYTLKIENQGKWPAYDFKVEDLPGAHLENITAIESSVPGVTRTGPSTWHVDGPLEKEHPLELGYTAELAPSETLADGDEVKNAAEIPQYFGLSEAQRDPEKGFGKYGPLKAGQNLAVELPHITLEKTTGTKVEGAEVDVGKPFPWRILVKNTAEHAGAKEVVVKDELPVGWTYKAGTATLGGVAIETTVDPTNPQKLTWTVAKLAAAGEAEILFQAIPDNTATLGENVNHASVQANDESGAPESEEEAYAASGQASATLVAPKFKVEKTPDGTTAIAGEMASYTIKVTNTGTGEATAFEVEDQLRPEQEYAGPGTLPMGVKQLSVNPTGGIGGQMIRFEVESLEAGESIEIPVPVKVPAADDARSTIENFATVLSPQTSEVEPDTGSFLVERKADLEMGKTANGVNGGEGIVYTLTATNNGPSNASHVVIEDQVPVGTTFVEAGAKTGTGGSCEVAGTTVTCNVFAEIAPGGKAEFEAEFAVDTGREEPLMNTAEVHGEEPDPDLTNNKKEVTTPITGLADLSILKTGPSQPVLLGSTFTYKLEVENIGPSNANEVNVVDELPAELEFVNATGASCVEVAGTVTCELGTLLPKSPAVLIEVTVKAVALPAAGKKAVNTAGVESPTPDIETENNHSAAETEILPAADLAIAKTAPATVEPDGTLTYSLHVENRGPSIAHKVVVTDPLPAGVDFVSAGEGCAAAGTTVTCPVVGGDLEVGKTADFQITAHVPFALGGQALTNTATVGADEADPRIENNSSTVTTDVGPAADLSIVKTMGTAQAGEPLTYTLAVTNKGPSGSSSVTAKDTLPAGTTFKSAAPSQGTCSASVQTVTCELGQLASGGSAQVSITVEVAATATGSLRNVATVEGPLPDPDKSNNESAVEGPVAPPTPTTPNLKVVKTADTSTPMVGTPFNYDVAITNIAGGEAKNVKVVDTLNGPVKVVSIEAGSGHCSAAGSKITCTIPSIPVGKTVHIIYSVIAEAAGPLSNTASAEAANGEKAPSNNHAVKAVKAKAPKGTFSLTKTATRKVVPGGKKVGFTITLRNGGAALTNAKVCDRLPSALVFVKAAAARYVNGEACWTKTYVAAHKVLRLHLLARAVKGYTSRQARNVATASAANASRRSASATVRVKPAFAGKPGGVTG